MMQFQKAYGDMEQGEEQNSLHPESYHKKIDGLPYDIEFPEITIKTVDRAVMDWFNKQHILYMENALGRNPVRAVFSSAERFAMMNAELLNSGIKIHDTNGTLILPIISVKREENTLIPERTVPVDEAGVTNLLLYVRAYEDPNTKEKRYKIVNRDVANIDKQSLTERIEIQFPTLTRFRYNVTLWSKFYQHLNAFHEHLLREFGQFHVVYASEMLYFRAYLESNAIDVNDENLGNDEKIIKGSVSLIVEAPLINEKMIRSRVSIQKVDVDVVIGESVISAEEAEKRIALLGGWADENPYQISNFDRERKKITRS